LIRRETESDGPGGGASHGPAKSRRKQDWQFESIIWHSYYWHLADGLIERVPGNNIEVEGLLS
jgi:hypothetical protein